MAARIGSLFVSLVADMSGFTTDMQRAGAITRSTAAGMRREMGLTERSVSSLSRSASKGFDTRSILTASRSFETMNSRVSLLRGTLLATTAVFGGLAAALGANILSRYADQFTSLQNNIRGVAKDTADLAAQTRVVGQVADRSRSSLAATATLYSRLAKAAPQLSSDKLLRYTETINKSLQTGGATAQEAASAAIQFSQAIQSNRLGGEELRAVLETPLGGQLAKGLGVTIAKMREMSEAGQLTADVVLKALDKIGDSVDSAFAKSIPTLDQSLTILDNRLTEYVGQTDKAYGVTRNMGRGVMALADNLDTIIPLLGTATGLLAAGFIGRRVQTGVGDPIVRAYRARQQAVEGAAEEYAKAQAKLKDSQDATSKALAATLGGQRDNADKGALKAYQRDLAAVEKLDKQRLQLLDEQGAAVQRLGEKGARVTPAMVEAARDIVKAEAAVNGELRNQATLRRAIDSQSERLTDLLARQSVEGGTPEGLQKLQSEIAKVEGSIARSQQEMAASERRYAQQSVALANQRAAAQRKVSSDVMSALEDEQRVRSSLSQNEIARDAAVQRLRTTAAAAEASGARVTAAALDDALKANQSLGQAVEQSGQKLAAARRNASLLQIAFNGLKTAGSSLLAFVGGPWGLAFAAAGAALAYFAGEAAKSAARADALREEMRNLGLISEESANKILGIAEALNKLRADELRKKIGDIKARLGELNQTSFGSMFGGMSTLGDVRSQFQGLLNDAGSIEPDNIRAARQQIVSLVDRINDGSISAEDLNKELAEIAKLDLGSEFDDALEVLTKMGLEALGLNKLLKQTGDTLNGISGAPGKTGRRTIQESNDNLQKQLDAQIAAGAAYIDKEIANAKLEDRAKAIADEAEKLAESLRKANKNLSEAVIQQMARSGAEKIVDIRDTQEDIGKGILAVIRRAEGTGPGTRGYNETLGNGRWTGGDVDLVNMTLNEVRDLQRKMLTPENKAVYGQGGSSAVGAYQIVGKTLDSLMQKLGLRGDELFSPEMQDRLAMELLRGTKGDPDRLRGTWEGLKVRGYSDEQLRKAYNSTSADIGDMDPEVKQRNKEADEAIVEIEAEKKQAYYETMQALKEEVDQINLETQTLGMSEAQKRRAAVVQDTINRLTREGIPVTAEMRKQIEEQANAQASALEGLAAAEQRVAAMDELRETTRDVLGGFINDLMEGKSAVEALGNALKRLAARLLDAGLDKLMDGLFGQKGMGGGGLLSGLFGGGGRGGLFGGALIPGILHSGGRVGTDGLGSGRRVSASAFVGAPRFHGGLTSNEFATILERGEHVLTARQAGRTANVMGGLAKAAANSNRGGGVGRVELNINNPSGDKQIREMVQQGVQAGLSQYDQRLDVTITDKIAVAQNRR